MLARARFILFLLMCALLNGAFAVPASAAAHHQHALGLPKIVRLAKHKAEEEYPGAHFYGAEGYLEEPTTTADDVTEWRLNFSSYEGGSEFDFSYVYSPDGQYLTAEPWRRPLGIEQVSPFSLTQNEAVELLRRAGHTGQFDQLYAAQPLIPKSEPIYYFCVINEGQTVGVGTHTHKVYGNLFPCA